jgi:hypothetical protein
MNPFSTYITYFPKIHFNIRLLFAPRHFEWYLHYRLSRWNFVHIFHLPLRATFPANLTLLYLITPLIPSEQYKLLSFPLHNFLLSLFQSLIQLFFALSWLTDGHRKSNRPTVNAKHWKRLIHERREKLYSIFFSYGTTAHTWALSSSVLRCLNHTQLDTR